jgi:hypothetical protein
MAEPQYAEAAKHRAPNRVERTPEHAGEEPEATLQRAVAATFRHGRIDPRGLTPHGIMLLQRTAGNAAVNHLLQQQQRGDEARRSRTSGPILQRAITIQRALSGTVGNLNQPFVYGLVHGTYQRATNTADAHISAGGDGQGLEEADMLAAAQDVYQAMQARNGAGGPLGEIEMHPQGAVALKTVAELLGGALGGWFALVQAATLQWKRKKFSELTKSKMADEIDEAIIPEHMAFLGALVGVGGVSITAVLGQEVGMADFTQNMLDNSVAGKARMETYRQRLVADRAVSMNVKVSQTALPQIIALLQSRAG